MAEREGFEPSVRLHVHTLSRRAPSTAQTSLQTQSYHSAGGEAYAHTAKQQVSSARYTA